MTDELGILVEEVIKAQKELREVDPKNDLLLCSVYYFGNTPVTNPFFHDRYDGMKTRDALKTHYKHIQREIHKLKSIGDLQVA